jgi:hypothetical protein
MNFTYLLQYGWCMLNFHSRRSYHSIHITLVVNVSFGAMRGLYSVWKLSLPIVLSFYPMIHQKTASLKIRVTLWRVKTFSLLMIQALSFPENQHLEDGIRASLPPFQYKILIDCFHNFKIRACVISTEWLETPLVNGSMNLEVVVVLLLTWILSYMALLKDLNGHKLIICISDYTTTSSKILINY